MFNTHRYREKHGDAPRGGRFARAARGRGEGPSDGERGGRHDHGHDHAHRGGGHGRHGKGGLGRFFAHGDLRLVVLNLINDKPSHGYELIKAIEERVSGAYSPSPGVIYPTLTLLEELGYITVNATGEGAKKLHTITAEGQSYLQANRKTLDGLLARMDEAGRSHRRGDTPQIMRAMENLKLALRLRLGSGTLTDAQVTAVAAAIDAAATAVEQV